MAIIEGSGLGRPLQHAGAPVDGVGGTYAGIAPKGALLIDTTNGALYVNTNTQAEPTWTAWNTAGVTADANELNLLDGSTAGTAVANKAAVLGADKELDELHLAALYLGAGAGTDVTATADELNVLAGVTAGTVAASKAVVVDANKVANGLAAIPPVTAYAANGAIAIAPGICKITKGTAADLTIADPAAGDEGTIITIVAATAAAHTVSNAAGSGFNAAGAAGDVATFGGAIGDNFTIVAIGQKWLVLSATNVTFS